MNIEGFMTQSRKDSSLPSRTGLPAWQTLVQLAGDMQDMHMRDLFDRDPQRAERFSLSLDDFLLDFSKNRITEQTLQQLLELAEQCDLGDWIERMFQGEVINHTEQRAVLHTALRASDEEPILVDGKDVLPEVKAVLLQMRELSEAVRSRRWRGYTGQPITDVVNIGVGGSDLGPLMACEALRPYAIHDLRMHFVSNVDENHILDTLESIKPETTLFIIASKSFTTRDTLVNARTAREWFLQITGDESAIERHFVAVSDNVPATLEFGIPESNVFRMWDWVGGRYSMWSAVGLSIAISVGMDNFEALLEGAREMDHHFRTSPLDRNMPVIMGLLGIWYNNFLGAQTYAVLPYDQHLKYLPDYLRQMDMESNGKSVDRQGKPITDYETGPVLFGQLGITGQHAFYQLMHQGTKFVPADIIAPITSWHCIRSHHRTLMSNVFAQTEAFMRGKTEDEARADMQAQGLEESEIERLLPYRVFPGNKPTNTILFHTLDPRTLGRLIALYEHKVFVQGVIWNINSFDQWGVELGKQLASKILPELEGNTPVDSHDVSTNSLINYYKSLRPDRQE
jgi:glucose-6-phosphate isomerase